MATENIQFQAGTPVYCSDGRLGTLAGIQGSPQAPLLAIQSDGARGPAMLFLPPQYVAGSGNGRITLNLGCAEATRLGAAAESGQAAGPGLEPGETLRVPLVGERLVAQTEWRQAGALEVGKTVRTAVEELDVPVQYEQATVERVAVDRVLHDNEVPQARQEGDTYIVPVVHEQLVVVKRRVLVEELRITKELQTRTQHVAEEVRREEISLSHPGLEAQQPQGQ